MLNVPEMFIQLEKNTGYHEKAEKNDTQIGFPKRRNGQYHNGHWHEKEILVFQKRTIVGNEYKKNV